MPQAFVEPTSPERLAVRAYARPVLTPLPARMFRALAVNTFVSALSFLVISIIGLLLIPLLIGAYGLTQYGLLVLARLFLPTGLLGILDLGFSETATRAVARARIDQDWNRAFAQVSLLICLAAIIGLVLALVLSGSAGLAAQLLNVEPTRQAEFAEVLRVTGWVLVLAFPCLALEGVVKGCESFRKLRMCEVVGALSYAILALLAVYSDASYASVAYAYLASVIVRATIVAAFAFALGKPHWKSLPIWGAGARQEVLARCRLMFANKFLGTAQAHTPPILISLILDTTSVAVYDVLVRLPRFAKSVLGLMNAAVLPVASRLEAAADSPGLSRLNRVGLITVAAISLPPLAAGAVFSKELLSWWISETFAEYWIWQSVMFLVPALTVLVGYGATSLLTRARAIFVMNKIMLVQLVLHLTISLSMVGQWKECAFIFGQVTATGATFLVQMKFIGHEHNFANSDFHPLLAGSACIGLLVGVSFALNIQRVVSSPPTLVVAVAVWCTLAWTVAFFSMLSASQRHRLLQEARALFARTSR